jgi:CRISPR-associated endonuclease Csn1
MRVSLAPGKNAPGITKAQIPDIVDPVVRQLVKNHVEARGGDPEKAFPPFPRLGTGESSREVRKVRIEVRQQMELMADVRPDRKTYADLADNHHMEVFRLPDGSIAHRIVSLLEATRRMNRGRPIVNRAHPAGGEFLMSLAPGDTLQFPLPGGGSAYRVVISVWAAGQIVLREHNDATGAVWKRPIAASIVAAAARKVAVDPIGRVRAAND